MTVRELIDELATLPPDARVRVIDHCGECDVTDTRYSVVYGGVIFVCDCFGG